MKVIASDIKLSAQHEAQHQNEVKVQATRTFSSVLAQQTGSQQDADKSRQKLARMLESLVETLFAALEGKKCRCGSADDSSADFFQATAPRQREVEWQMEVSTRESESERTQVEGSGQIRTADGRCLDFKMCVVMQRQFERTENFSETGKYVLHDPLVLNYTGNAADLTSERIDFDLDADGENEKLAGLAASSGYLVLDRNGNGKVDDGRELFGTTSGNGFADLKKLDADGNGWLDEADPMFAGLKLWSGQGGDRDLKPLVSAGVGAIYLGSVESPFALKDSANRMLGEIRSTGLWLGEDGHVGSLQQVDLAVSEDGDSSKPPNVEVQAA